MLPHLPGQDLAPAALGLPHPSPSGITSGETPLPCCLHRCSRSRQLVASPEESSPILPRSAWSILSWMWILASQEQPGHRQDPGDLQVLLGERAPQRHHRWPLRPGGFWSPELHPHQAEPWVLWKWRPRAPGLQFSLGKYIFLSACIIRSST